MTSNNQRNGFNRTASITFGLNKTYLQDLQREKKDFFPAPSFRPVLRVLMDAPETRFSALYSDSSDMVGLDGTATFIKLRNCGAMQGNCSRTFFWETTASIHCERTASSYIEQGPCGNQWIRSATWLNSQCEHYDLRATADILINAASTCTLRTLYIHADPRCTSTSTESVSMMLENFSQ